MPYPLTPIRRWAGGALCFACSSLWAATPLKDDFHNLISRQDAAITTNAAFLPGLTINKVSYLEASVEKLNGGFVNYYQSDNSFQSGLQTESYYRLSPRLMLHGSVGYSSFKGKNMEGSAFINPYVMPFDIVESDDAHRGSKRLDTYRLQGALGYQISSRFSAGADLTYTAGNYAKHKDLRHKNTLLDMELTAGGNWKAAPWLTAGMSYYYHRRSEDLVFQINGAVEGLHYSLISFGNFFGRTEAFGENGYTSDGLPLFTQTHGGALQLQLHPEHVSLKLFNEFHYHSSHGRFGTDASTSVTYTRHNGHEWGYQGRMVWDTGHRTHVAELSVEQNKLTNNENSYRESTDASGVTQIVYYGSNEVLKRTEWKAHAAYTLHVNPSETFSDWVIGAEADFQARTNNATLYPYFRKQDLHGYRVGGHATRYLTRKSGVYGVGLLLSYGSGGGNVAEDGLYATPGNNQKAPDTRNDLLHKEYEYLTNARATGGLSFHYERTIIPSLQGYADLSYHYTQAFHTDYAGDHLHHLSVRIGCRF